MAHFDERMMHMPWREFVTDYLAAEHGAVHLVAGHDFHFGYKGEGNPERLRALCGQLGIGCDIIPRWRRITSPSPPPTSAPSSPRGRWSGPTSSWATPTP